MAEEQKVVLGYWNIRGIVEPIRYVLEYIGTPYENKLYEFGSEPSAYKAAWYKERDNLGLDFPNLPYLLIDGKRLTQSLAILRYLSRKHNLGAENPDDVAILDMLELQVEDFRWGLIYYSILDGYDKLKGGYVESLPGTLKTLADFLGSKKYLLGDKLTYVDFTLYEGLDHHIEFRSDCLKNFPNLEAYHKRIGELPAIASYRASKRFQQWPLYGPYASRFGWKKA